MSEGAGTRRFFFAHDVDWSFKLQPLLGWAMTAMHDRTRRRGTRHALGRTRFRAHPYLISPGL